MKISKSVLGSVAALSLTVISAFAMVPAQTSSCSYMINSNLRLGTVSTDVQNLQKLLNMAPSTMVASTGAGSMGYETLRFGPATMRAVKAFQAANGITPVSGYVGPKTRATLNMICTGTTNTTTTTTTTTTNSGITSNNIPVSVLVQGQAGAMLGQFVVTGNGVVTGLTLARTGLSNNSTLKNVYLYDGMTRLTDASSVLTDGSIRFNSSAGLFPVSGSKTITVKADIASSGTSGQTVGVALTGVTMMGATTSTPVTGVSGPLFSISSATTVTADFPTGNTSLPGATAINAGSMNQTIWSRSMNIGVNPAWFHGITVKQIGSAPANTLANVQLYIDGSSKATGAINANNQFVFDLGTTPFRLTTGSHTVEIRGDVVGGANRNFYISAEQATDIAIEDSQLAGVYVTVTAVSGNAINLVGGLVTINNGTLTSNQDTAFNTTTTLVGGASNVTVGSYKFTAYGEDVKISSLAFLPVVSSLAPANTTLANVGLYINGGQVGSNQTVTISPATAFSFTNLGSNLYVPAGQTVIVQLKADIMNSSSVAYTAGNLAFNMTAGTNNAQGISSSQLTSTSLVGGQSLTIASSNVTFAGATGFAASTKAPNTTMVKIGSFTLQTGSAEGVVVTNIAVPLAGTMIGSNQITNVTVKDGSNVVGTPIGNPTATNNFSANINVPVSSSKVFDVYADFGSGASTLTAIPSMTVTYRGMTSNLSAVTSTVAGVTTTAGVASIALGGITYNTGLSPVAQLATAGQSNFNAGTYNFKANTSVAGAMVRDVTFSATANTVGSVTMNGKSASFVSGVATIYNVGVTVPADASGINVPVTIALANVGIANGYAVNSPAVSQATITMATYYDGANVQCLGATCPTPTAALAVGTNAYTVVNSKPTFSVNSTQQTGLTIGAENKIGEVTIAADANGQIKIDNIAFNVAVSGLTAVTFSGARIADGNTTISGSSISSGCTAVGACVMTFGASPNGYTIAAGSSKTFSLYATVAGTVTASTVVTVSSAVTAATTTWDDVSGGGTNMTASSVYNFPTGSYSIRQ